MSSIIRLHISKGSDANRTFDIQENQTLVVGRGLSSDTKLTDPALSRVHFSVEYLDGRIMISDLGSLSGTFLNGLRIDGTIEADSGDEIAAGDSRLFLSLVGRIDADTVEPSRNSILVELNGLVGTMIGGYLLQRIIGVGRSGLVFEAYDPVLRRQLAVKVFSLGHSRSNEYRERFIQGTKTFSKIQDPHLIRLYKAGKSSSAYYYVAMELVVGESLDSMIGRVGIEGMLDWKEAWKCAYHISSALMTTYGHNVIHCNLVPRNIIRRFSDEQFMLGDFILASPAGPSLRGLHAHNIMGELHYLPPERINDAADNLREHQSQFPELSTDIRSDIFGLGATCYAMLTGKPPASGANMNDVIDSIRKEQPPLPTHSHLSVNDQFQSVVMKMIAKNPNERYQTPQQLLRELGRIGRLTGMSM